jgi:hypothetical protein
MTSGSGPGIALGGAARTIIGVVTRADVLEYAAHHRGR